MKDGLCILPAAQIVTGRLLELVLSGPCSIHLMPSPFRAASEIAGRHPGDAFRRLLLGIVQDVRARSFETGSARMQAWNHWRWVSLR